MRNRSDYYNEWDKFAAQWLRNLIAAGHLPAGDIDERSIADVRADDLRGYRHCHFFAGIGGWPLALRLAGWPEDRPVWTGSCPCQPFSAAGKQRGSDDERHLWPTWARLIRECRPGDLLGEQVAGSAGLAWLDHVCGDLESAGYAAAAAVLPAGAVGAPHRRERLWFVANAECGAAERRRFDLADAKRSVEGETRQRQRIRPDPWAGGELGAVADADSAERWPVGFDGQDGRDGQNSGRQETCGATRARGEVCAVADADGGAAWQRRNTQREAGSRSAYRRDADGRGVLGDTSGARLEEQRRLGGFSLGAPGADAWQAAVGTGAWRDLEWLACRDGKARPTQPGLQPLAHGIPGRVGRLRAYGNAIVPQVAAEFIAAVMECRP